MRKLIIAISLLLLIMILAFYWASNNLIKRMIGTPCNPHIEIEMVNFNLMDESFNSELEIIRGHPEAEYYREYGDSHGINEDLFQFIIKYCISKNLTIENQLMAVVLYYDALLYDSLTIADEDIKGVSLYEVKKNRIIHRLYVRNEQANFVEEENVKVAVPYISSSQISFYLENYVFADPQNKSKILLWGSLALEIEKNPRKYRVPLRFEVKPKKDRVKK